MSDAICPRCGDDNITDYPVCDGCATVAHFTHRKTCLHCVRKRAAASNREEIRYACLMIATEEMFELLYKIRNHIDSTCHECESKAIVPEIDALIDKIEGGEA